MNRGRMVVLPLKLYLLHTRTLKQLTYSNQNNGVVSWILNTG